MITVLAGGVGAARFLRGLLTAVDPSTVAAVVNTADDTVLHGLAISPDLDTVTYTLGGSIDPERGWGLTDESWRAMDALGRFDAVRPPGSRAGERWFNLGDQDLATHFYRTTRLAEGASLTEVTAEIAAAFGVPCRLLPMTDAIVRTMVATRDHGELSFQEYFVGHRHAVPVSGLRFAGARDAAPTDSALAALEDAEVVVIAPSNPLVSIGPIRALGGIDECLAGRRESVVAVSPIIAGAALKGPADRMLQELGHESSVVGVARLYAPVCGTLVIDTADAESVAAVEATGMRCVVAPTVMSSIELAHTLALTTLEAARCND